MGSVRCDVMGLSEEPKVSVTITLGDLRVEFSGKPEVVAAQIDEFLHKQIPTLDLAKRIYLSYSTKELVEKFEGVIKITPEGPRVWFEGGKLSDKEKVALQLVAAKIGHQTARSPSDALLVSEIQQSTNLNPKSVSSRLSELVKGGLVERVQTDQGVKYRITTQGISWLIETLSKRALVKG
jgi:predicted transcriptional regulator